MTAEITRGKSQLSSEKAQIEALRGQLKGLSPGDQELLAKAGIYTQQQAALDSLLRTREEFLQRLDTYKSEADQALTKLPDLNGLPDKPSLEIISAQIKDHITAFGKTMIRLIEEAGKKSPSQEAINGATEAVANAQKYFKEKYAAAKARSTSHQSSLTELERLERSTQALEIANGEMTKQLIALGDPASELAASWKRWIDLHRKRSDIVKAQCEKLHGLSGGKFRARAKACGDPEPIKDAIAACFANKNIRKAEEKIESITTEITTSADPLTEWFRLAEELQSLQQLKEAKQLADTPILEKALLSRSNRESLQEGLTADAILELRLTSLDDEPEFEFRIGPDAYITFAEASSGQQATTLLKVLLNQDGPPLLIDQPEEDLDNEVIQEIAMAIWETKSKRQLLFVSHNANIVVNGDAELVVCFSDNDPLKINSTHIEAQGAIDIPAVKESIKRIMEGGDNAFELRRQKYGF